MGRDRAAYMREYRARQRRTELESSITEARDIASVLERNAQLEEEVRHLKAELAKRPIGGVYAEDGFPPLPEYVGPIRLNERFNTRPFTPVPKSRK